MGRLCTNPDDCRSIVSDVFIAEGEADGTYKFCIAMFSFVLGVLHEDGREGVDSFQLVVRNDHVEREKTLLDGKEVVISWFPFKRGKVSYASLKRRVMASGIIVLGFIRELGEFGLFSRTRGELEDILLRSSFLGYNRAGAVENRDDDDQSDCVGKGELKVLGAFGDSSESVGSCNCDCSSGGLVGIKFELDIHCREQ
jgi:hypothetical protein